MKLSHVTKYYLIFQNNLKMLKKSFLAHRPCKTRQAGFVLTRKSSLSCRVFFCVLLSEGLAVGVGFGAVEKTASATFESAR